MLMSYYLSRFLKFYVSETKKSVPIPAPYCWLFFLGTCFAKSVLNSTGPFHGTSQGLWFKEPSLGCLVIGSSVTRKNGRLPTMTSHCHLLSFVIIPCHSLSFDFTRCHLLSLAVQLVYHFIKNL